MTYGQGCNPETAFLEMVNTKLIWNKEDGVQYKHLIQSFADYDNITPEQAYEIGQQFLQHALFQGFQVLMAVHQDKEHVHIHYAINTVNVDNGRKWNQRSEDLQSLRDCNDNLCREHGLVVIPQSSKGKGMSDGEFRHVQKGTSWKHELWLTVERCLQCSKNREDFMGKMEALGYGVNWTDARKYVTFTTPDGKKCRNNKLYPQERYTKEAMEAKFQINERYMNDAALDIQYNALFNLISMMRQQHKDTDFHRYPLSQLEGQALNDYLAEQAKGTGVGYTR